MDGEGRTLMPTMRESQEAYTIFCDKFLPCVVGSGMYNQNKANEKINKFATVSDEAFVHLCLENSIDMWGIQATGTEEERKRASTE